GAGEARRSRGGAARERLDHRRRRARVVRVVGLVVGPLLRPQAVRPGRCSVQPALRGGPGEGRAAPGHRGGRARAPPGHLRPMTRWLSRHRVAHWLWERRGTAALARLALLPLAFLFRGVMVARAAAYRRGWVGVRALPAPSVAVGNLSVGGSGKTPIAAWIARYYRQRGRTPAILLRGYGADEPLVQRRPARRKRSPPVWQTGARAYRWRWCTSDSITSRDCAPACGARSLSWETGAWSRRRGSPIP